ncbi:hypothetical protein CTAYLR_010238 [Chrysophaeum taylorii]|uniref:Uncharacterized protein n=1 Tax=Chrysophaeum taylorii TaxID=2483200 RepID=A0AAD7UJX9_9STRA|nr:hypothetical protein CTAYLR_010238 [Chrysophaeum taylorii]
MRPAKRFRPVQPSHDSEDVALGAAAARLLTREVLPIPYDAPARSGRVALHNERFLRAMLQSTEAHNRRLPGARPREAPNPDKDRREKPKSVEVTLEDDRDAGIIFEQHPSGRPVVRGLTAWARPEIVQHVVPGMLLSRIAGVKCKAIKYDATLDLVRALEKPLKLTFKAPKETKRSPAAAEEPLRNDGSETNREGRRERVHERRRRRRRGDS